MKDRRIISGYRILKKLGESIHAEVFKVHKQAKTESPLVLKRIKPGTGSKDLSSFLKHQVVSLENLDLKGVIIPAIREQGEAPPLLVQKYFDGINLSDWRRSRDEVSLNDFFEIGCSLAEILDGFHDTGHIHEGIKPNNILIGSDTLNTCLIDPVRTADMSEISNFIHDEGFRVNTLNYISPEQTGRIKQQVDFTTDLYSLGIVFYELLSGAPPFFSDDPLELIHSHLAEDPVPLCERNPRVPLILSDIIGKLIHKAPEKRFQTGRGLFHDLARCRDEYGTTKRAGPFPLGLRDRTGRIHSPSIMIGREREKELLLREHAMSCSGSFRAAIISGPPGIGKTRLIQELQAPIAAGKGYFTSGKYDQYQRHIPYGTLKQATGNLMRTFITEAPERVRYWKETIGRALAPNGRLMTDLVPELELIIGPQPQVPPLPPGEATNRFNAVAQAFVSCMARSDHPVTLFVDDLQWCDIGTLRFIRNVFAAAEDHPYLFLLAAYRHDEVDKSHPVSYLLRKIREMGQPLLELRLEKLNIQETNELVSYMLDTSPARTRPLSELIDTTSEGNPLHIREAISWLHEDKVLSLEEDGTWHWDEAKIARSRIPETMVDLFAGKIERLPKETRELVRIGACLGASFSLEDLSLMGKKEMGAVRHDLSPAFRQRILMKGKEDVSFLHDKIQEAVYRTLDKEARRDIHALIAHVFMEAIPEGTGLESLDNLFQITQHLNKGRKSVPDKEDAHRDARFNYFAGKKAMELLALETANRYFKQSKELLSSDSWDTDYELTFSLYRHLARSELTLGNQRESETILHALLEKSRTDLDKVECLGEQTSALFSLGHIQRGIEVGNQGLAYFHKAIPDDDAEAIQKYGLLEKELFERRPDFCEEVLNLPPMDDRGKKTELSIYLDLMINCFLIGRIHSVYLSALQSILCCLDGGINESVAGAFCVIAHYLQLKGRFEDSFKFEDMVKILAKRYPNTFGVAKAFTGILSVNVHNRNDPETTVKLCLENIQSGKVCGDMYSASLSYLPLMWNMIAHGVDLSAISDYGSECMRLSRKYNINLVTRLAEGVLHAWSMMMDQGKISDSIEEEVKTWKRENQLTVLGNYLTLKGISEYYRGNYTQAMASLEEARASKQGILGTLISRLWNVFFVLTRLRLCAGDAGRGEKERLLEEIDPLVKRIDMYCRVGPLFRPYLAFIHAELARITGEFREARTLYLDAVDTAREYNYTLLEGHIHESLGEILLERGNNQAGYHIKEAEILYDRCHAQTKLRMLRERYPQYFRPEDRRDLEEPSLSHRLDTVYLMKASRTISGELDLDELLKTILKSVMEGLGAQRGYLLTADAEELVVRVYGTKGKTLRFVSKDESLSESKDISKAIVRYVQRTKETVILGNALEEGPFFSDGEVRDLKLRSVLCQPIMKQKKLLGIIYLQNNLISSAFTEEQIEFTRLLSSHAAIALENAVLVDGMKNADKALRKSEERYRALFNSSVTGTYLTSLKGKMLATNEVGAKMLGSDMPEELVGKEVLNFYKNPEDRGKIYPKIKDGNIGQFEVEFKKKDGADIIVLMSSSIIELEGRKVVIGSAIDITERKRAEVERERLNAELIQKNKELEQILYVTSHDLRSPLVNIQGFSKELESSIDMISSIVLKEELSSQAKDELIPLLNKDIPESLQFISRGTSKMDSLLSGLLHVSRLGQTALTIKQLDMNRIMSDIASAFEFQLKNSGIELQIERLPLCRGDDFQINQMFTNLIDNALKYLDPDRHGIIKVSGEKKNGIVVYCVEDNGIGIARSHQDKIFEIFYRLDPERGGGEGLGLNIVRKILDRHKGTIWVESEPGKGSRFYVSLPAG